MKTVKGYNRTFNRKIVPFLKQTRTMSGLCLVMSLFWSANAHAQSQSGAQSVTQDGSQNQLQGQLAAASQELQDGLERDISLNPTPITAQNALSETHISQSLRLNMPNTKASSGLDLDLGPYKFDYRDGLIDAPSDALGSSLFNLDIGQGGCYVRETGCLIDTDSQFSLDKAAQYVSLNKSGLGLELVPRASVRFDDESESALVGALVRIGDDLREDSDFDSNTWYFFAGADAEALTYRPNSPSRLTQGNFNLQDRIIVGDAQAGLGYRIGDADLSLAYIRREVSGFSNNDPNDDYSYTEDAAALSFTWRR